MACMHLVGSGAGSRTHHLQQEAAQRMLEEMQAAGCEFDARAAMLELTTHLSLTQPQVAAEACPEAPTPCSEISSRFSLSGDCRSASISRTLYHRHPAAAGGSLHISRQGSLASRKIHDDPG